MAGYLSKEHNESAWINGWFITGDLGYLSEAGWLSVTGRAKDVIKRGGETISPMDIEEAVRGLEEVVDVAAFAISDRTLGENVALALVPRSGPRIGLPQLRSLLVKSLRPALMPQALVYYDRLPKTAKGTVRRAWLCEACKGISISQDSPWRQRVFCAELAQWPPQSREDILVKQLSFDGSQADAALCSTTARVRTMSLAMASVSHASKAK
jgi:acyl-coenzyme A synthetase/AMP-(fatty) acid ligase